MVTMPDDTPPVSTSLVRVDRGGDTPQSELAPEVRSRLREVHFHRLLQIAHTGLEEYARIVDGERTGVEFVGVTVVGSFLTDEFEPHQSDLDVYLLTDEPYEDGDAFCRTLLDPDGEYRYRLNQTIPQNTTYVDPLGLWVEGAHWNAIREPSLTLKRGDE